MAMNKAELALVEEIREWCIKYSTSEEIMTVIFELAQPGNRSRANIINNPNVDELKTIYVKACKSNAAVAACYMFDGVPFYRFVNGYYFV